MRAEHVISVLLKGDAGVVALIGARVYPSKLPQNTVMPAIAYECVGANELTPIDASAGQQIVQTRIQINCMAKGYDQVKTLQEAVRLACLYKSGVIGGYRVLSITRSTIGSDLRDDSLRELIAFQISFINPPAQRVLFFLEYTNATSNRSF
jgi:Protein of unknown function (DUF3168)